MIESLPDPIVLKEVPGVGFCHRSEFAQFDIGVVGGCDVFDHGLRAAHLPRAASNA
jgi:hypothetical protein